MLSLFLGIRSTFDDLSALLEELLVAEVRPAKGTSARVKAHFHFPLCCVLVVPISWRGRVIFFKELTDVLFSAGLRERTLRLLHNLLHNLREVASEALTALCLALFRLSLHIDGILVEEVRLGYHLPFSFAAEGILISSLATCVSFNDMRAEGFALGYIWYGRLQRQLKISIVVLDRRSHVHSSFW